MKLPNTITYDAINGARRTDPAWCAGPKRGSVWVLHFGHPVLVMPVRNSIIWREVQAP